MPKIVCSKTCTTPRRPFEKERLNQELKIIGEYGLRNKREVWRVKYTLAKIRKAARELLTLEEKDPRRLFEGNALLRRLVRIGVLDESRMKLDYVLGLRIEDFLERRLQTQVFKLGLAKSIHHARVLIRQRHIRWGFDLNFIPVHASLRFKIECYKQEMYVDGLTVICTVGMITVSSFDLLSDNTLSPRWNSVSVLFGDHLA